MSVFIFTAFKERTVGFVSIAHCIVCVVRNTILVRDHRVRHHALPQVVCLRVCQQHILAAVELLMQIGNVKRLEVVRWVWMLLAEDNSWSLSVP
jgi:hypothetical protein